MSIGGISFWQQNQNFWNQARAQSQASAASNSLITAMGGLIANKAKGLASIATHKALVRTNNQIVATLKSAIAASQGNASTSASSPSTPPKPVAATGTGTVPLSTSTSLITLGIPANGAITVSDGTNVTTYASTGTDSVGDLINTINASGPKQAQAKAYLNAGGHLVITSQNNKDTIAIGGIFASSVGFGRKNQAFQPALPGTGKASSSAAPSASTTSSPVLPASSAPAPKLFNSAHALQTGTTALTLLANRNAKSAGVNLLA
jgi:hypothetical protein